MGQPQKVDGRGAAGSYRFDGNERLERARRDRRPPTDSWAAAIAGGLIGRDSELGFVERLLDRIQTEGGSLVVSGEPGIGKSALLAEGVRLATERGMLVLRTTGVQSETRMPFAGLHKLLGPVLRRADQLPLRQRDALGAAFGASDGDTPDAYLIALSTLQLLSDVAADAPLLVIAEDAHWLDPSTRQVITFVGRRLESEPIVLLVSSRDGSKPGLEAADLPELHLDRLQSDAAASLMDAHSPDLASGVRRDLLAAARGNPLALIELPVAWQASRDVTLGLDWLPLTTRLEHAFAARAMTLPADARTLLLVAALSDGGAVSEVLAACSDLVGHRIEMEDLSPAVSSQLVDLEGASLVFRHPLVRSAIYQAATLSQRHAAHASLAGALVDDPDRRVWHRAASIIGPDEVVAIELEAASQRALRRRGMAAAVAALELAARLSEDRVGRGARMLRAAELAYELGRPDVVRRLIKEAEPMDLLPDTRRRLLWLREYLADAAGVGTVGSLVALADQMREDGDDELALKSLLRAALKCWWFSADDDTRAGVTDAAQRLSISGDDATLLATLAYADPVRHGAEVIDTLSGEVPDLGSDPETMRLRGTALTSLGAFDHASAFLAASVGGLRKQGRLGLLAQALVSQAMAAAQLGNWSLALPAAQEAERLARETAQPRWTSAAQIAQATIAGFRGSTDEANRLIEEAEQLIAPLRAVSNLAFEQIARGAAALGVGRHGLAYQQLVRIFDPMDMAHHPIVGAFVLPDVVDAALQGGHDDEARILFNQVEDLAMRMRSPIMLAGLAYARPLLARETDVEAHFQAAMGDALVHWPFWRARLLLNYGIWLRRRRRVGESRAPLAAARDALDGMLAVHWAERARQELRATGETSHRRAPDARERLTPQELQIAEMAAAGLSNREIGEALYLSHRTVGSHLYRIFPKLGVAARSELADALAQPER
jgi:DNA-binding CsgD family transcriptional regulator